MPCRCRWSLSVSEVSQKTDFPNFSKKRQQISLFFCWRSRSALQSAEQWCKMTLWLYILWQKHAKRLVETTQKDNSCAREESKLSTSSRVEIKKCRREHDFRQQFPQWFDSCPSKCEKQYRQRVSDAAASLCKQRDLAYLVWLWNLGSLGVVFSCDGCWASRLKFKLFSFAPLGLKSSRFQLSLVLAWMFSGSLLESVLLSVCWQPLNVATWFKTTSEKVPHLAQFSHGSGAVPALEPLKRSLFHVLRSEELVLRLVLCVWEAMRRERGQSSDRGLMFEAEIIRMVNCKEGILCDVFSQKCYAVGKAHVLNGLLWASCCQAAKMQMTDSTSCYLRNLWPTFTTRSTIMEEISAQVFSQERRKLQTHHLWMVVNLKWGVLVDRMCVKAPTGKSQEDLDALLFTNLLVSPARRKASVWVLLFVMFLCCWLCGCCFCLLFHYQGFSSSFCHFLQLIHHV